MKRVFDIVLALVGLLVALPVLLVAAAATWLQDRRNPFYVPERVGRNGQPFHMMKLRSMVVGADAAGIDSTASDDSRITPVGAVCRAAKLDEIPQLWNVLVGDMSLVGPRPNIRRETERYTDVERALLSVRPGITDLSSIVFSDLGAILEGLGEPNLAYNQLVRPWKSRLGLLYVERRSFAVDVQLLLLTAVAVISRDHALRGVQRVLQSMGADEELLRVSRRLDPLEPSPPPGARDIVTGL